MASDFSDDEVETVAQAIAEAVGSRVFEPLHDNVEDQKVRERFRDLAQAAIAVSLDEGCAVFKSR